MFESEMGCASILLIFFGFFGSDLATGFISAQAVILCNRGHPDFCIGKFPRATRSTKAAREYHTSTLLSNRKALVAGGYVGQRAVQRGSL
jgi:hypothetical protein